VLARDAVGVHFESHKDGSRGRGGEQLLVTETLCQEEELDWERRSLLTRAVMFAAV
jgi:hypothetical protein